MMSRLFGHIKGRVKHFIALLQERSILQFPRNIQKSSHRNYFCLRSLRFPKERKMDVPESYIKCFTALAFIFDDEKGIMVAANHSSNSSIVELNSHMLATICGGNEFLLQDLQKKCHLQEQKEGKKTSVAEVLKWLAETLSGYKEELSVEILIAVWNESEHGLYCMNGKGELVKDDVFVIGCSYDSAMTETTLRPYAACSHKFKLSVTEAARMAETSICVAAYKALYRGRNYSVYHLGWVGCNKLKEGDLQAEMAIEG